MIKKVLTIFGVLVLALIVIHSSFASETEGTIVPGVDTGVTGSIAAAPTVSPDADTYSSAQTVTLTAAGADTICYTIDGTDASCDSSTACTTGSTVYTGTITISSDTTIKTTGCYPGNTPSNMASYAYTINIPTRSPGGGGSYTPPTTTTTVPSEEDAISTLQARIAELQLMINNLLQQLGLPMVTTTTVPGVTTTAGFTFKNNLSQGMVSEDIRYLQRFLNSHAGTKIADTGPGSSGQETNYFGELTKAAVIKFQNMYASEVLAQWGLTKGTGYVGQSTRKKLNELLGQ